jgi:hypothetical protein
MSISAFRVRYRDFCFIKLYAISMNAINQPPGLLFVKHGDCYRIADELLCFDVYRRHFNDKQHTVKC